MTSKSHNAKKPKLAAHTHEPAATLLAGTEGAAPDKHKMSFAQHQHELQAERITSHTPLPEAPEVHLKTDAQQHQQKAGSRR